VYEAYYHFNLPGSGDLPYGAYQVEQALPCALSVWDEEGPTYGGRFAGFEIDLHANQLDDEPGIEYGRYRYTIRMALVRPYEVYTPLQSAALFLAIQALFDRFDACGIVTTDWSGLVARYESRQRRTYEEAELFDSTRGTFVFEIPDYASLLVRLPT
jgi:hypothetical protein